MIDAATAEFLELVDCDPSEVRDIPAHRMGVDPTYIPPERRRTGLGNCEMYFGMHRGKLFRDIPKDYLRWLAAQPSWRGVPPKVRRMVEKTKRRIRDYLKEEERCSNRDR